MDIGISKENWTPLPAEDLEEALQGKFKMLEFLKQGGMAAIYLCYNNRDKRLTLKVSRYDHHTYKQSLLQEFEILSGLTDENIIRVYECGDLTVVHKSQPCCVAYFSMDYVEGWTLSEHINAEFYQPHLKSVPRLSVREKIRLARHLCRIYNKLSERGIGHRDISPENVIVCGDKSVKIIDFSASYSPEFNSGRTVIGKDFYRPPEMGTARYDPQCGDVFSFGKTLAAWFTGSPEGTHWRPPIPTRLKAVVIKASHTDPSRRYRRMSDLDAALRSVYRSRWLAVLALICTVLGAGLIVEGFLDIRNGHKAIIEFPSKSFSELWYRAYAASPPWRHRFYKLLFLTPEEAARNADRLREGSETVDFRILTNGPTDRGPTATRLLAEEFLKQYSGSIYGVEARMILDMATAAERLELRLKGLGDLGSPDQAETTKYLQFRNELAADLEMLRALPAGDSLLSQYRELQRELNNWEKVFIESSVNKCWREANVVEAGMLLLPLTDPSFNILQAQFKSQATHLLGLQIANLLQLPKRWRLADQVLNDCVELEKNPHSRSWMPEDWRQTIDKLRVQVFEKGEAFEFSQLRYQYQREPLKAFLKTAEQLKHALPPGTDITKLRRHEQQASAVLRWLDFCEKPQDLSLMLVQPIAWSTPVAQRLTSFPDVHVEWSVAVHGKNLQKVTLDFAKLMDPAHISVIDLPKTKPCTKFSLSAQAEIRFKSVDGETRDNLGSYESDLISFDQNTDGSITVTLRGGSHNGVLAGSKLNFRLLVNGQAFQRPSLDDINNESY